MPDRRGDDAPSRADQPGRSPGAVVIPFPSRDTGDRDQSWHYEQPGRGTHRRYTGQVTYIRGVEGQRLREELTAVLADLLHWARQQQSRPDRGATRHDDQAA